MLLRLDTSWAAATGLTLVDPLSASDFIAQHLHLALDAGEPSRIARGAALEWAARHADWRFRKGSAHLLPFSKGVAESIGTPQATAMLALADSIAASAVGKWKRALTSSERALAILLDQCVGVTWEAEHRAEHSDLGGNACVRAPAPAAGVDERRAGLIRLIASMTSARGVAWSSLAVVMALYVVGAVSVPPGSLRHEVQTLPLWFPIIAGLEKRELAKWAALPCLILWLTLMICIWLFLLGWARIVSGHFSPTEVAMTLVVGAASLVGLWVSLRWRTAVRPVTASSVFLLFAALQLLALRLSLIPYIASR